MSNQISSNLPKYYIYKLYFKSGKTYIGQHTQRREKDRYVTSSFYYKNHKEDDPLEKREILLEVKDLETLNIMETVCIMQDKVENGKQNVNGNLGGYVSWRMVEWTPERRKKLSERNKGRKPSESTRRKMSEAAKNRPSRKGTYNFSEEAKRKISISQKEYYRNHPGTFLGKKHTEETRQKLREKNLGKRLSEESRRKMSESRKGKNLDL